ncbi:amidohydrolase family protein [Kordiimonas lipolytica]|uniref:Amidohydrolase family protein n=1 Tax=Kordiimonas lipolytica TaxID=1662421 RepID=A0ABV8U987_9PROT|nr:amidohydrolase family protein [Kordiimonas lipolytica]
MRILATIMCALCVASASFADNVQIENVTVISMDGGQVIKDAVVTIEGDRIVYVGTVADAPHLHGTHKIIDGTGKYLIPGLAEMHGHLPYGSWGKQQTEETLFLYLAGGVTTVRGMLGDPVQFELRDKIKAGEIAGPTLYLAAPSLNGRSVSSPEDGEQKLRLYASQGWDLQKIHPGLSLPEYDAIARAANELGFPFGGHVPADVGIDHALKSHQISVDHMDGYLEWLGGYTKELTDQDFAHAVAITRASGTWIVPTQELFNTFYSRGEDYPVLSDEQVKVLLARPENAYVPRAMLTRWEQTARSATPNPVAIQNRQQLLKAFADGGVNLALGSDAPQTFSVPGFSIWREIEVMAEAGLTPAQILEMATAAPGRYFKDKDDFGAVTVGARADLILLDADPREDAMNLTKQAGVVAAGRWYSREAIDARLAEIAARHAN